MDANRVLYDYIVGKYGGVANLSGISDISPVGLNAVLLKDNVSKEIRAGLSLCEKLNIDVEKIVFESQITDYNIVKPVFISDKPEKPDNSDDSVRAAKFEIYNRCMRLSEIEKRDVLEYMESILSEKSDKTDKDVKIAVDA